MGVITDPQATTPDLALFLADLLTKQWLGDTDGILRNVSAEQGAPGNILIQPATNLVPQVWGAHGLGYDLVLIGGAINVQLAARLYAGYTTNRRTSGISFVNGWLEDTADAILAAMVGRGIGTSTRVTLVGHSAGGALAQVIADRMQTANPNVNPVAISFGSPAPGGIGLRRRLDVLQSLRLMNDDDPIPLLPLEVSVAPWIVTYYDNTTVRIQSQFVQPRGGLSLDKQGVATPLAVPAIAQVAPVTFLAAWIASWDSNTGNPHAITEYLRRIRIWWFNQPARRTNVAPVSSGEAPTITTRQAVVVAETHFAQVVANQAAVQTSIPPSVPVTQVFRAVRQGREWFVAFGDTLVVLTPHRRGARAFAAAGNAWLRRLQRVALVHPDSFALQFKAYLAAATDPAGGFTPVIPTTLPL